MIFIKAITEEQVQVDEKTRVDVSETYTSPDEASISLIEIDPDSSGTFYDVTTRKYLDWSYSTDGDKVIVVRVTTDGSPVIKNQNIRVVLQSDERLFTDDQDLYAVEESLKRFLKKGKDTFNDKHREAQRRILDSLDRRRIRGNNDERLTAQSIWNVEEVRSWSRYLTLQIIFEGVTSEVGDIYSAKAQAYGTLAKMAEAQTYISLDNDKDGEKDQDVDLVSGRLVRR